MMRKQLMAHWIQTFSRSVYSRRTAALGVGYVVKLASCGYDGKDRVAKLSNEGKPDLQPFLHFAFLNGQPVIIYALRSRMKANYFPSFSWPMFSSPFGIICPVEEFHRSILLLKSFQLHEVFQCKI
jgi:hypothetical protein